MYLCKAQLMGGNVGEIVQNLGREVWRSPGGIFQDAERSDHMAFCATKGNAGVEPPNDRLRRRMMLERFVGGQIIDHQLLR